MPAIYHVDRPLAEPERNRRIYQGDVIVFRGVPAVARLGRALRALCRRQLGDYPPGVHRRWPESSVHQAAERLRAVVRQDAALAEALAAALEAVGADPGATYRDALTARVQVAGGEAHSGAAAALAAHRDTWGSNIMAQTNWWGPLWATEPESTLALFPSRFATPVPNDSARWDFRELARRRRRGEPPAGYPLLPLATRPPPRDEALAISLLPGDLMCFSGAHLHATVPNATDRTRLSFETRTVNGADAEQGRGAPNVDGAAPRTTRQLFRRLTDGRRLAPMS